MTSFMSLENTFKFLQPPLHPVPTYHLPSLLIPQLILMLILQGSVNVCEAVCSYFQSWISILSQYLSGGMVFRDKILSVG